MPGAHYQFCATRLEADGAPANELSRQGYRPDLVPIGAAFLLTGVAAAVSKTPQTLASTFVVLAGVGVFITGALFEERVLYAAGLLWWCGALVVLAAPQHVYLIEAALLLFGYLLPAYLIRNRAARDGHSAAAAEPASNHA